MSSGLWKPGAAGSTPASQTKNKGGMAKRLTHLALTQISEGSNPSTPSKIRRNKMNEFIKALKILNIEDYENRIFRSNSKGELSILVNIFSLQK